MQSPSFRGDGSVKHARRFARAIVTMSVTMEDNDKPENEDADEAIADLDPGDEEANRRRRRLLLRRFWKSALGFWRRGGDRLSWALSAAVLCTIVLNLATAYGMNLWIAQFSTRSSGATQARSCFCH